MRKNHAKIVCKLKGNSVVDRKGFHCCEKIRMSSKRERTSFHALCPSCSPFTTLSPEMLQRALNVRDDRHITF
jgi:hypothetical protein